MKIGYFFRNGLHTTLKSEEVELGNPGTGGRAFMNLSMAYFLNKQSGPFTPVLFTQKGDNLPGLPDIRLADDVPDAISKAHDAGVWLFVTDVSVSRDRMGAVLRAAENFGINLIVRLGLFPSSTILHMLNNCERVQAVVAVEHYVLDVIRDHPVAHKTIVLPNGVSLVPYKDGPVPVTKREKAVTYLGSLVPQKGFGRLARAWPSVLKAVPDAKLKVIGSGHTYGDAAGELGEWGVADEAFEASEIRPYLSDEKGAIHTSVQFLGSMGTEKAEILRHSMIGVANPVGDTETFCIGAVEIQAAGTPVIAGAKYGLFDTVCDGKTGFLVHTHEELSERIIQLLNAPEQIEAMGKAAAEFAADNYDFQIIIQKWISLFETLAAGCSVTTTKPKGEPVSLRAKLARLNSTITNIQPVGKIWPSVVGLSNAYYTVNKTFRQFVNQQSARLKKA